MEEYTVVGKRLPLIDAVEKATGRALFTGDMELPKMLHARILRSPHAHARVLHVDASKAERLAGVKVVLTKDNAPRSRVPATLGGPKEKVAFDEKVRYAGDEVAAVAAVSREVALEALNLIKVEYEELPAVFDPEEAIKPGSPLIHEDKEQNIAASIEVKVGDTEAGFRNADYVFEETFRTSSQRHASMETHASIASFDVAGRLAVWSSTQLPFHIQRLLAEYLDIPMSKVRVVKPYLGGGFGGKLHMVVEHIAALLSRMTGRPVRLVLDREEEFSATITRHALIIRLRVGASRDGTLTAIEANAIANAGAYLSVTGPSAARGRWVDQELPMSQSQIPRAIRIYQPYAGWWVPRLREHSGTFCDRIYGRYHSREAHHRSDSVQVEELQENGRYRPCKYSYHQFCIGRLLKSRSGEDRLGKKGGTGRRCEEARQGLGLSDPQDRDAPGTAGLIPPRS